MFGRGEEGETNNRDKGRQYTRQPKAATDRAVFIAQAVGGNAGL